jgi:hypothetical protein
MNQNFLNQTQTPVVETTLDEKIIKTSHFNNAVGDNQTNDSDWSNWSSVSDDDDLVCKSYILDAHLFTEQRDYQGFIDSISTCRSDATFVLKMFEFLGKLEDNLSPGEANIFLKELLTKSFRRFYIEGIVEPCLRFNKDYLYIMCEDVCRSSDVRVHCLFIVLKKLLQGKFTSLLFKDYDMYNKRYVFYFLEHFNYDVELMKLLGYSDELQELLHIHHAKRHLKFVKNKRRAHHISKIIREAQFIPSDPIKPSSSVFCSPKANMLYKLNLQYKNTPRYSNQGEKLKMRFKLNTSALTLIYGNISLMSRKYVSRLYELGSLVEIEAVYVSRPDTKVRVSDFVKVRVIHVADESYYSVNDIFESSYYWTFFVKNKNLRQMCYNLFEREEHDILFQIRLQNLIDRSFAKFKPLGKLIIQGATMSCPINVKVEHTAPGMEELYRSLKSLFNESIPLTLIKTVVFVRTMCMETNPYFQALLLANYCTSIPGLLSLITNIVGDTIEALLSNALLVQGNNDEVIESTFITVLHDIFVSIDCSESFFTIIKSFLREVKTSIIKSSAKSFGERLMEYIAQGFELIKQFVRTGDINVFYKNLNPVIWVRDGFLLVKLEPIITNTERSKDFEDYLKKGDLPSMIFTPLSIDLYIDVMSNHIVKGDEMLRVFKDDKILYSEITKVLSDLKAHKALAMNKCVGNKCRACPFALYIHGAPGVGKTTLCNMLFQGFANRYGYDRDNGLYSWRPNVNFQDSFDHTKWCILCDDIDTSIAAQTMGFENHCQIINALVNNAPFQIEQASVDMKGKIFANPALILYTSNSATGRANQIVGNPEAFFRRFKFRITLKPKPAFSTPTGMLDSQKCMNSKTRNYWFIDVYEGTPLKTNHWNLVQQDCEFDDFIRMYWKKVEQHRKDEAHYLKTQKVVDFCNVCFLPNASLCNCTPFSGLKVKDCLPKQSSPIVQGNQLEEEEEDTLYDMPPIDRDLGWDARVSASLFNVRQRINELTSTWTGKLALIIPICAGIIPILYLVIKKVTKEEDNDICVVQERVNNNTNLVVPDWRRMNKESQPGLPMNNYVTWTKDEIIRVVQKASFNVSSYATPTQHTELFGVVYDAKHIIVNRHLVTYPKTIDIHLDDVVGKKLTFMLNNVRYNVILTLENFRFLSHSDLMVVHVVGLSHSSQIRTFVQSVRDESVQNVDGVSYVSKDKIIDFNNGQFLRSRFGEDLGCEGPEFTTFGDCGGVYIFSTDVQKKFWKVGGIHWAINEGINCVGGVITAYTIDQLIKTMCNVPQCTTTMISTFVKPGVVPEYKHLGIRSEIAAAQELLNIEFATFGTMIPSPCSSTLKFKTQYSLLCKERVILEYEKLWCGEEHYWRLPLAKIKNCNNSINYDSCYINAFKTMNTVIPDSFLLNLALIDYLQGITDLDNRGYSILSNDEVVRGISGSFIHSVNMNTSIGPPYNTGKRKYVSYNEYDSYIDPEIFQGILTMEQSLLSGEIVSVCGICVPKDEPNKPNKFTRIFTSLPYSFNFLMKKYGGPMKSFIRGNQEFFESMVGTNMTGLDCNRVVELLRKNDPYLVNLFDADIKAMDKSWSPQLFEIVAKAVYAISRYIGVNAEVNYTIVQSLLNIKYSIQGDLFSASWNPSGNDWTVELNGLLLSICARYVYYKCCGTTITKGQVDDYMKSFFENPVKEIKGCTYRDYNSLVTYGDDNVQSVRWVIPPNYFDIWLQELGMTVTPADKSKIEISLVDITQIQFLKRTFKFNKEFGCYVAALDKKSMIRMLIMKKPSTLSGADHACISCSEFLREMFLHSRDEFIEWQQILITILTNKGWINNSYFINKPYDYWVSQFLCGEFYTWVEHDKTTKFMEYTNLILQMNIDNNYVQGSSIESSLVQPNVNQVATFVATDPADLAKSTNTKGYLQNMPEVTLDQFLTRPVEIESFAISNADVALSVNFPIDPIALMFANAAVAQKINNFSFYRGTLQIIARIAVPPGTFGLYSIGAMPRNAQTSTMISDALWIENVMQPIHVMIDIAKCTEAVLQLPFIYDRDFAPMATTRLWDVYISCLQPIATGIEGGFTIGEMKLYASFLDDYKLVIPQFQAKLQANEALRKYAPKVHNIIGEGKGSKMMGVIQDMAAKAKELPFISSMASTVELTAGGLKSVLSYFGFTRQSTQLMPIPITMRSVTNVANCDGNDPSDIAALMKDNKLSIDATLIGGNEEDILSNTYLFSKYTLVSVIDWDTSAVPGTILGVVPVTPYFHRRDALLRRHFTTAGFVGLPFSFWRGSMEYLIMIPVSVFHRGTLQIVWNNTTNVVSDPTNVTFNYVFNIAADENQHITIDYVKSEPMLNSTIISNTDTILAFAAGNGFLSYRVVNPLFSQAAVTSTKIYTFARAGPDMEFGKPTESITADDGLGSVATYNVYSNLIVQGALGDGPALCASTALVKAENNYPIDMVCIGERFESVRALIQKPCKIHNIQLPVGNTFGFYPFLYYPPGQQTTTLGVFAPFTYASYYLSLYAGIAGSERWKYVPSNAIMYVGHSRVMSASTFIGFLDPVSFVGLNRGLEYLVPYYYNRKFITPLLSGNLNNNSRVAAYTNAISSLIPYYSMGPDVSAIGFRQVPAIRLAATGGSYPVWFEV